MKRTGSVGLASTTVFGLLGTALARRAFAQQKKPIGRHLGQDRSRDQGSRMQYPSLLTIASGGRQGHIGAILPNRSNACVPKKGTNEHF